MLAVQRLNFPKAWAVSSPAGMEPVSLARGRGILNHWTAREVAKGVLK